MCIDHTSLDHGISHIVTYTLKQNNYTGAQPITNAEFGEGINPVLGYLNCLGRERGLAECKQHYGPDCHHGRDVGVKCQGTNSLYDGSKRTTDMHDLYHFLACVIGNCYLWAKGAPRYPNS